MFARLARSAAARPRGVLAVLLAVAVLLGALAVSAPHHAGVGGFVVSGSESERASDELRAALRHDVEPGVLLVTRGDAPVSSGVYRVALQTIVSQLRTERAVAEVGRGPVAPDRRTTALKLYLRDRDPAARESAVKRIERGLDPGPLRLLFGGEVPVRDAARDRVRHELGRLELLALPLTLLVLAGLLGARIAVGPGLAAAIGLLGGVATVRIAGGLGGASVVGAPLAVAVGLAVGLEASFAYVARYREEAWTFGHGADTVRRAGEDAGPAIAASAASAAAACSALWLLPLGYAHSMALAGAVAALLAGAASLVAMPAALALAGSRLKGRPLPAARSGGRGGGAWYRLVSVITGRRLAGGLAALLALAALVVLAFPAHRFDSVSLAPRELPPGSEPRLADARLQQVLGRGGAAPLRISAPGGGTAGLGQYAKGLSRLPGVVDARVRPAGRGGEVDVSLRARQGSTGAQAAARRVRAASADLSAAVGGESAIALDARERTLDRLPFALLVAIAVLAGLLFGLARMPVLVAVSAVASLLPAAAVAGLLVTVFQDARFAGLIDYTPAGAPHLAAAIGALTAVVAISAARAPMLVAAVGRERRLGSTPERSLARGATLSHPGHAAATLIVAAAAGVLAGSLLLPAKEFGLAIAAGAVLDLVLVRLVLIPALAALGEK